MDTFAKIREMASKLNSDLFTKEQYIIITGVDESCDKMYSYTSGDFFGIIATLSYYIERLEKNNCLGISKYKILDMIRESYEEDEQ